MRGRILYLGDSVVRLNTIKNLLEDQGYEIWTAREAGDALRMLRALDFEAMLIEQQLMGLEREQLLRVKTISPELPVLSVSEAGHHDAGFNLENALRELDRIMQPETSEV